MNKEELDPIDTLKADAKFLRHYLQHYTVGVQTRDWYGNIANSFAAVQIPDWAVRQRLDDIDATLQKHGSGAAVGIPMNRLATIEPRSQPVVEEEITK